MFPQLSRISPSSDSRPVQAAPHAAEVALHAARGFSLRAYAITAMVAIALCLSLAPSAAADAFGHRVRGSYASTRASDHFMIHYNQSASIDDAKAAGLLAQAERAYAFETGTLTMPQPPPDGDGLTDIYVLSEQLTGSIGGESGGTFRDNPSGAQSTAYIELSPSATSDIETVPHEFMHVLQDGIYAQESHFLKEATANWAAYRVIESDLVARHRIPQAAYFQQADRPIDLPIDLNVIQYRQWPFFESLSEGLGDRIVREIFEQASAIDTPGQPPHTLQAIEGAVAAHGSSLAREYLAYSTRSLGGSYLFGPLRGQRARAAEIVPTGRVTRSASSLTLAPVSRSLDHLSSLYIRYGFAPAGGCRNDLKLELRISAPLGMPMAPLLRKRDTRIVGDQSVAFTSLPVRAGSAEISIPWEPCLTDGALVVQNASSNLDAQPVQVTARLVVATAARRGCTALRGRARRRCQALRRCAKLKPSKRRACIRNIGRSRRPVKHR